MAKQKEEIQEFVNPFNVGLSYDEFLKSIPKGIKLEDYLKGNLEKEQIDWIVSEINNLKTI